MCKQIRSALFLKKKLATNSLLTNYIKNDSTLNNPQGLIGTKQLLCNNVKRKAYEMNRKEFNQNS